MIRGFGLPFGDFVEEEEKQGFAVLWILSEEGVEFRNGAPEISSVVSQKQ
jgi:hypothetical protein